MCRTTCCAALAVVLCFAFGCNTDDPAPENIIGPYGSDAKWFMDVQSSDGLISIKDAATIISATSGGYAVQWMSDTVNGSATYNTNTHTVTMRISHRVGDLDLLGTLENNNYMAGSGTIDGLNGLRIVTWNADRQ